MMRIALFIFVTIISSSLGLKCWHLKPEKTGFCEGKGKKVDTSKCDKQECPSNAKMCRRETTKIPKMGTKTILWGCWNGEKGCKTTKLGFTKIDCYCDKDLCNEAAGQRASLIIVGTLFICMLLRNEL